MDWNKKITRGNQVQSRGMTETAQRHEYRNDNKSYKRFSSSENSPRSERLWRMWESREHQAGNNWQKNWSFVRAQLSHYKVDFRKSAGNRNEQSRTKNEQAGVFRSVRSIHQQDSNLWVLAWLHKTKVNKIW